MDNDLLYQQQDTTSEPEKLTNIESNDETEANFNTYTYDDWAKLANDLSNHEVHQRQQKDAIVDEKSAIKSKTASTDESLVTNQSQSLKSHVADKSEVKTASKKDNRQMHRPSAELLEQTVKALALQAILDSDEATWKSTMEEKKQQYQRQGNNAKWQTPSRQDVETELAKTLVAIKKYKANGKPIAKINVDKLAKKYIKADETKTLQIYYDGLKQPTAKDIVVEAYKKEPSIWDEMLLHHYNELATELINAKDDDVYVKAALIDMVIKTAEKQWTRVHDGLNDGATNPYTKLHQNSQILTHLRSDQ